MTAAPASPGGRQLWGLLPEHYRARDNGDLASYVDALSALKGTGGDDWTMRDRITAHFENYVRLVGAADMGAYGVMREAFNEEFAKEWETENEEGLRGGWDALGYATFQQKKQ